MLSPRYFKEKVCEELEDASHYLKKAIDVCKTNPEWSMTFKHMADGEQEHATDIYRMFMEMYTTAEKRDQFMEAMRDGIMECFSIHMRKIEDLKATYDMMMHQNYQTSSPQKEVKSWNPPITESSTLKAISE